MPFLLARSVETAYSSSLKGRMQVKNVIATAVVDVTVSFVVPGRWGAETSAGQIYKQALETAHDRLRKSLRAQDVVIKGEPKVTMVLVEEESSQ